MISLHIKNLFIDIMIITLFWGYFNLILIKGWVWWIMWCCLVTDKNQLIDLSESLINCCWVQYRAVKNFDSTQDRTRNLHVMKLYTLLTSYMHGSNPILGVSIMGPDVKLQMNSIKTSFNTKNVLVEKLRSCYNQENLVVESHYTVLLSRFRYNVLC
jgi:hypothetical protein